MEVQDSRQVALIDQITPKKWYFLPDTQFPEQMLQTLSLLHVTEQLESAGMFLFGAWSSLLEEGTVPPERELMLMVHAYLYQVGHEAWTLFCQSLDIPRHVLLTGNYEGTLLSLCDEYLLPRAPSKESLEEMIRHLPLSSVDQTPLSVVTPELKPRKWQRLFGQVCREWRAFEACSE
jgi:hypothetical protein